MFMGPGILVLFDSAAYLMFIPFTLFAVLGPGALWVLLPFVALLAAVIIVQNPLEKAFSFVSDSLGDISQYVHEESQGARFFRAEGLLEVRRRRYDLLLRGLFGKQLEISRWELGLDGTLQMVIQTSYLVVLTLAYQGQGAMAGNLGALTVSLQLLDKLLWPLMSISYLMNLYQQARTGARRYQDIEALPHKEFGSVELFAPLEELKLRNFDVRSPTGQMILKGINFHARAGEHIALVGAVGSGKTVLLQSLAGLWENSYLS
jgi:ABC-type multidrug transport system fused ATPase/permease subunit